MSTSNARPELTRLFRELAEGGQALPPRAERLRTLLTSPDHHVRVVAERMLFEAEHGKPAQAVAVKQETTVSYVVEAPTSEARDEWLARHAAAQAAAADVQHGDGDEGEGVN